MVPDQALDGWWLARLQEHGSELTGLLDRVETRSPQFFTRSLIDLRRFLATNGRFPFLPQQLHQHPFMLDLLLDLVLASRYGFSLVLRHPRLFSDHLQRQVYREVWGRTRLTAHLSAAVQRAKSYDEQIEELINWQQWHHLRLIMGDLAETLGFEAITSELSALTDVLVEQALQLAVAHYQPRYGTSDMGFVVFGLGKLGGNELNYSSDIDLIFVVQNGDKSNAQTSGGRKSLSSIDYWRRVGQELIRILDGRHPAGRLYRVDMRLRPEGNSGPLVLSQQQTLAYYYSVGRPWERRR